jgi:hypothetical protein
MKTFYWVVFVSIVLVALGINFFDFLGEQTPSTNANERVVPLATNKSLLTATASSVRYSQHPIAVSQIAETNKHLREPERPTRTMPMATDNDIDKDYIARQNEMDTINVLKSIEDPNPKVRLQSLTNNYQILPPETLANLMLNDKSDVIRLAALRFMASSSDINVNQLRSNLELATNDYNQDIVSEARNFLTQINESATQASSNEQNQQQPAL